ncbi:MAG TPA: hypothetical protein VLF43_01940, partial [Candidatus Saccharimonadales bacterium]|nr:hypothetical protein [Candidatus Saccharimonadales bacterium]
NGISSMVVYRGGLYLGTAEPANTEVYRYAGGSTFIDMVAPFGTSGQDQVSSMASYDGMLVIGLGGTAGNAAGLYMYGGESVGWQLRNGGAAGNVDGVSSGMDDIPSMSVYGNALYLSTSDGVNSARWYRYNNAGNATTSFTAMHTSAGTLVSGGTGSIESIATMTAYNGNLYLGTQESNGAEVYKYDGATVSKVSQTTAGTIKASGTASIDGVTTMAAFNDLLFVGTNESNSAQLYTYNAVEGQSRTLRFAASSDNAGSTEQAGFPNEGSIFFAAEASTGANLQGAATGTFVFSHGITVTAGAYDLAEDYPTRDDSLVAGDLVSVDPNERGFVRKATGAYDPGIVGVYSAKPALRIGQADATINGGRAVPIALAGRVPLKVSTENGAIKPGDPLAASSVPGVAMKATATGRIVGMAMESYDGQGEGMITVFVNPNFYGAAGGLQGTGDVSSLLVHGDATIDGDLTVVGTATVGALVTEELTVSGTAHVQDLYVGGSLVLGSSTEDPTAQAAHPITQRFKASKPIVAGSVVIVDTLPGWVTTTTSAGDTRVVGVATTGATSAGQVIEVAIGGTAKVSVEGTVAPGQLLRADASEGHASVASSPGWGELVGKVIGTPDNNGKVLLLITLQ